MAEKLTFNEVKGWIPDVKTAAANLSLVVREPNDRELRKFVESFNRTLILHCKEREIADIFRKHAKEILLGFMVMKEQVDKEFDGDDPKAGTFGMTTPIAGYFGEDGWAKTVTAGTTNNIIHAGNTHIGGTSGDPIKVTDEVVHVIIGYGNYNPSPKCVLLQETIDGKTKPHINTEYAWRVSDLQIKELNQARILKKDTTYKLIGFADEGGTDEIYVVGVTFLTERLMRINDPANMAGSTLIVTS